MHLADCVQIWFTSLLVNLADDTIQYVISIHRPLLSGFPLLSFLLPFLVFHYHYWSTAYTPLLSILIHQSQSVLTEAPLAGLP